MRYKIISKDDNKQTLTAWTTEINNMYALRELCQYFIDNISGLEDFYIMDCENQTFYNFLGVVDHWKGAKI